MKSRLGCILVIHDNYKICTYQIFFVLCDHELWKIKKIKSKEITVARTSYSNDTLDKKNDL